MNSQLPGALLTSSLLLVGCTTLQQVSEAPTPVSASYDHIAWDTNTLVLVQAGAGYARMIRLQDGRILCCYQRGRKAWVKASSDNGRTWGPPTLVAEYEFGVAANPELLQLADETVLCAYNERPKDGKHPFAIMLCESTDGGTTWSTPQRLYDADIHWGNGCWEPAMVQLPSGEVQVYFANENPYRKSREQEISMVRRMPGTNVWSEAQRVSFRRGRRDGMPVPLVLKDHKGIVVVIEDNGIDGGHWKPAIVQSSLEDNWRSGHVGGNSDRRWKAVESIPRRVAAAAPYIRQLPNGQTILSTQNREGGYKRLMVVYIGDDQARSFGTRSVPFKVPRNVPCSWNSLFIKNSNTVTAVSGTAIDGVRGVWAIDGRLTSSPSTSDE
jgi:hypothetical protein